MYKKKKAIVVIDNLYTGGVSSSLYNYLKIASVYLDCDLLVFNESSIDCTRIPEQVNILHTTKVLKMLGMNRKQMKAESQILGLIRSSLFLLARIINGQAARALMLPFLRKQEKKYDWAISFAQDDSWKSLSKGCNDYVVHKVVADRKAVFVHNDYVNFGGYHPKQERNFSLFDNIICVSESCCQNFIVKFPRLENKVIACENFTDIDRVLQGAENSVSYQDGCINFVSVSRLSLEKGISRTIDVFAKIYAEGIRNFTWTVVGDGLEYKKLSRQIKAVGLDEKIVLVGNQSNPYPYIKGASALLVPSLNEAAPMVFGESAVLGVPVVSTNTCSAVELVEKRNLGIVVENSTEGIYSGIKAILSGEIDLSQFRVEKEQINSSAMKQFIEFIQC